MTYEEYLMLTQGGLNPQAAPAPPGAAQMGPPAPPVGPPLPGPQRGSLAVSQGAPGGRPGALDRAMAADLYRRQAEVGLQTPPKRRGLAAQIAEVAGPLIAGIATGGAAIPAAVAFAVAKRGQLDEAEDQRQSEWERTRFGVAGKTMEAAADVQLPGGAAGLQFQAKQGRDTWFNFDPRTGQWIDTGVSIKENRDELGAFGKFIREYTGKDLSDPSLTPDMRAKLWEEFKKGAKERLLISASDPNAAVTEGAANIKGAEQEAIETKKRIFDLRKARDDIEINFMPQLSMMATAANEILEKIESGEGTWQMPFLGRWLANIHPDLAEMQAYAVSEALQNLQITNLAPVTENELELIQTMAANPSAWNSKVNIRRLEHTLKKIARSEDMAKRQLGYIAKELGETQAAPVAPAAPAGGNDNVVNWDDL